MPESPLPHEQEGPVVTAPLVTAQYEPCADGSPRFVGWEPRECGEHRTVGDYRAWCYDCTEWCYSSKIEMACKGCEIVHLRGAQP